MAPSPRLLLRDHAYEVILGAIVYGGLPPGSALRDAELADRLGLSRTPVREALARLADEGLVVTKPNAFTRVAPLDGRAARDAAVLNQSLQGLAARLAATGGRFGPDHAAAARTANRRFADALDGGDLAGALSADHDVHEAFVDAAGNVQLALAIGRLDPLLRRFSLARFGSPPGRRSVEVHERLIDAAERADAPAAAALAEENWSTLVELVAQGHPTPTTAPIDTDPGDHRAPR